MKKKIRVGLIFGGRSTEYEVSLLSAQSIYANLDKTKYEVVLIGIDRQGNWILGKTPQILKSITAINNFLVAPVIKKSQLILINLKNGQDLTSIDIFFPIVHGTYGEDGCLQGLFELLQVPYVGANVIGSAIGMDKDVQKRLLNAAGIQTAKFITIRNKIKDKSLITQFINQVGFPLFIKPASLGSSVGVSKVNNHKELSQALKLAFQYDTKIMLEQAIIGREIECSVLGNDFPRASLPGEIIPHDEFYSYRAKYLDEKGASLVMPALLPPSLIKEIQQTAIKAFLLLECTGMARVDFFLLQNKQILVNEINTLPGFTKISMYPKLWEISGLTQRNLITQLINLALEKAKKRQDLKRTLF